jgi:hypothetical protein
MTEIRDGERQFWTLAKPLQEREGVMRSTMMGLPCLRVDGAFFASCDRKTGALLVKLPEARVAELVATGRGLPFAPDGRTFPEWVAIPAALSRRWRRHLEEALAFIGGG